MKRLKIAAGISFAIFLCLFLPFNPIIYANAQSSNFETPESIDWVYINRTMTNLSITSAGYATFSKYLRITMLLITDMCSNDHQYNSFTDSSDME